MQSISDLSEKRNFFEVSAIDHIVRKVISRSNGILNQTNPNTRPTVLLLSTVVVKFGTELLSATALGLNVNILSR